MPFPPNVHPRHVVSPKSRLRFPRAIHAGNEWSLAVGLWDGQRALLIRWNDDASKPLGNPISRSRPTWFVLPGTFRQAALKEVALSNPERARKAEGWLEGEGDDEWPYNADEFPEAFVPANFPSM